jgi:cytochrome c oxidase assembly protein subunit 15
MSDGYPGNIGMAPVPLPQFRKRIDMGITEKSSRQVANWLLLGVVMTIIQIALGGITRLTGSGLSITQWDVITGALPPLNEQQWLNEFDKYKQTPQFHLLNFEFSLADFKFIFFWEWFHRLWGRLIGVVFAFGFIYFFIRRQFRKEMVIPFVTLFFLGALQGAIGWIMVASGLTGDAIYVKPTRLSLHFIFALGLLSYTFWFALRLRIADGQISRNHSLRKWNIGILILVVFQLFYGALMAGHKAAAFASSWPTINGEWLPKDLFKDSPLWLNFIDNRLLIHFIHRSIAYLLLVLILIWSVKLFRTKGSFLFERIKWIPLVIVFVQVILGVSSLLTSNTIVPGHWGVFEWIAQLHQLTGMLLLLSLIAMLYVNRHTAQPR